MDVEEDEIDFNAYMDDLFTRREEAEVPDIRQAWDEQEELYAQDQYMTLGEEPN